MPIRCPAGALPDAYRVICLRSVRALASGRAVPYHFRSSSSKKCEHCATNNGACEPVPVYVAEEFAALKYALQAWEDNGNREDNGDGDGDDGDHDAFLEDVTAAAKKLALCVQVTRSQEKEKGVEELLMANHDVLRMLLVQVTHLGNCLASIEAKLGSSGP